MKNTETMGTITAVPRERVRHPITFPDDGLTKQAHVAECDINQIMRKYLKTGMLQHSVDHAGQYGFATSMDFQEAITLVDDANNMFNDLPSSVRARFENAPHRFLEFVQDEKNLPEMAKMGLTTPTQALEEPRTRRSGDADATKPETQASATTPVHKSTGAA
nr:MAG: internal scaffolding protein [Microvirus sp.]